VTLLEALVALVILGASAASVLGVFQNGARSVQSADAWNRATAVADAALEEAVRSRLEEPRLDGTTRMMELGPREAGPEARVDIQPWGGRVDDVVVRVTLSDGRTMTVHRLVRRR